MEEAIANVQSYNRKINQLRTSSQIQVLMIRMAKTDFYPLIYCGGSVGKITQFNTYGDIKWQDDQKVYLGLNYTLFNGLQRRFKIRQAKSEATMFNHAMQIAVNGIEIQTRSAWETMEMNRKRLGQTAGLVAFARKAYDITRKAYDIGTKTLLDLQQSEQSYNDALLKNSAARFALHSATVDLRVLLGNYLLEK
jgi:outer membrane protein TolC